MINLDILKDKVTQFIMDRFIPDIPLELQWILSGDVHRKKIRFVDNFLINFHTISLGILDEVQYSERMEDLYQQIVNHPIHPYSYNNKIAYKRRQWNIIHNRDTNNVTYLPYTYYKVIELFRRIDTDGILINKYHMDRRCMSNSSKSTREKERLAHRFVDYLKKHLSKADVKYLLKNLLDLIKDYIKLHVDYNHRQFGYIMEDYRKHVVDSDDGSNGAIKDIRFYLRNVIESANDDDDAIYDTNGQILGLHCLHFFDKIITSLNADIDANDVWYSGYSHPDVIMHMVDKRIDTIKSLVTRYNDMFMLVRIFKQLLTTDWRYMRTFANFHIQNIPCIEVLYDNGYIEMITLRRDCFHITQRVCRIYRHLPKCCDILIQYHKMFPGKDLDICDAVDIGQKCDYSMSSIIKSQLNIVSLNKHLNTALSGENQHVVVDENDIKNFTNLNDFMRKRCISKWYIPIRSDYEYEVMMKLIMRTYINKYLLKNGDLSTIEDLNRKTTEVMNYQLRKPKWIADLFQQVEHRLNINIKYCYYIEPKFLKYMYGDNNFDRYKDLFDPTTLVYHSIHRDQLIGLLPEEIDNDDYMRVLGYVRLLRNSNFRYLVGEKYFRHHNKKQLIRDIITNTQYNYHVSGTNIYYENRDDVVDVVDSYPLYTNGDYDIYVDMSNTKCDWMFRLPYLVYMSMTDKTTGKPITNVNLHGLPLSTRIIAFPDILIRCIENSNMEINKMYLECIGADYLEKLLHTMMLIIRECHEYTSRTVRTYFNNCKVSSNFEDTVAQMIYYDSTSGDKVFFNDEYPLTVYAPIPIDG